MKLVFLGLSTLDHLWYVEKLPEGDGKNRAHHYSRDIGGMASNAALTAHTLGGGDIHLCTRFAQDESGLYLKGLCQNYGLHIAQALYIEGMQTSVSSVVIADTGERMIVNKPACFNGQEPQMLSEDISQLLTHATALQIDTRWFDTGTLTLQKARVLGIPSIIDIEKTPYAHLQLLLPFSDYAVFSYAGFAQFCHDAFQEVLQPDAQDIQAKIRQTAHLYKTCVCIAVTWGAQGVYYMHQNEMRHQAIYPVAVKNTNGAGDAFHGALTWAIGHGYTVDEAMDFAAKVAAAKCMQMGRIQHHAAEIIAMFDDG